MPSKDLRKRPVDVVIVAFLLIHALVTALIDSQAGKLSSGRLDLSVSQCDEQRPCCSSPNIFLPSAAGEAQCLVLV